MKKVLYEQKFQYSSCVDINCAVEINKILGAKYMVVGSVSKISNTFSVDSRIINVKTAESYSNADFSHTGEIDYHLLEGMKTIAYKLCDVEYQFKLPAPVKMTVSARQGKVYLSGQGNTAGATLTLSSNPPGAFVYINNNYMGITPLELINCPPSDPSHGWDQKPS